MKLEKEHLARAERDERASKRGQCRWQTEHRERLEREDEDRQLTHVYRMSQLQVEKGEASAANARGEGERVPT